MKLRILLLLLIAALGFDIKKQGIFARAENMQSTIYVTNVEQNSLDHDEFQFNKYLKRLIITNQTISEAWLKKKDYLFSSPTLQDLFLTDSNLLMLPEHAFARLPNLTFLSLARNLLTGFKQKTLESMTQLEALDLSSNFLSSVSGFLRELNVLTKLRTLNVADNYITSLSIIKSQSLLILDISRNTVFTIKENDLVNLPSLDTLILTGNRLKTIHQLAFSKISTLTHLDLSNNTDLTTLSSLKMPPSRQKAYGLFELNCADCGIKKITPGTFKTTINLVRLDLARNNLTALPNKLFQNLASLQSLDLTNNSITSIPNRVFVGADSLTFLSLQGNPLKQLSAVPFMKAPRLTSLNVAWCSLEHVWGTANGVLKSLKYFSFASNLIQKITEQELDVTPNVLRLDMSRNPLKITQDLDEFIIWTEKKDVKLGKIFKYTENRWWIENNESEYSFRFRPRKHEKPVSNEVLKISREENLTNNQTQEYEETTDEPTMLGYFAALVLALSIAILLLYLCKKLASTNTNEDENRKTEPAKSAPRWRMLLNLKKCVSVKYEPLEEEFQTLPTQKTKMFN